MMSPRSFLRELKRLRRAGWEPTLHENGTILLKRPVTDEWMTPIGAVSFVRSLKDPDLHYDEENNHLSDWINAGSNLRLPNLAMFHYTFATRQTFHELREEGLEKKGIWERYRARGRMLKALKLEEA